MFLEHLQSSTRNITNSICTFTRISVKKKKKNEEQEVLGGEEKKTEMEEKDE